VHLRGAASGLRAPSRVPAAPMAAAQAAGQPRKSVHDSGVTVYGLNCLWSMAGQQFGI